jgi:3',5'-cyclic-AMP phosphodiesterase
MSRIAHLTDLHLLENDYEKRGATERARIQFLSFGRWLAPDKRRKRAEAALAQARTLEPTHLLITGDLTEDGHIGQFEAVAEVLAKSGIPAERITIVPGNHDFYTHEDAWARALSGPLRPYRTSSLPLVPVVLRDVTILPASTAFYQPYTVSRGTMPGHDLDQIARLARDPIFENKPFIIAQHHAPFRYACSVLQWIDGFRDYLAVRELLRRHQHTYVLHGHIHSLGNFGLEGSRRKRIFSGDAVVSGKTPVRVYDAGPEGLAPAA